jgi:hypothetical protein
MKANMKALLLDQTKIMLQELNQIDDVEDRLELRIKVAEFLVNFGSLSDVEINEGKDAIKENKAKVVIEEPEEEIIVENEEPEQQQEEVIEEIVEENNEVTIDEILEAKDQLDPDKAAEFADKQIQEVPVEVEEDEEEVVVEENAPAGPIMYQDVDITEAFNLLNPTIAEDFRMDAAYQMIEYGVVNEYKTFDYITEDDDSVVNAKILLAYWLQACGAETLEYYLNYFMSNITTDEHGDEIYVGAELHLDELNNNNVAGYCAYVESIFEEAE